MSLFYCSLVGFFFSILLGFHVYRYIQRFDSTQAKLHIFDPSPRTTGTCLSLSTVCPRSICTLRKWRCVSAPIGLSGHQYGDDWWCKRNNKFGYSPILTNIKWRWWLGSNYISYWSLIGIVAQSKRNSCRIIHILNHPHAWLEISSFIWGCSAPFPLKMCRGCRM